MAATLDTIAAQLDQVLSLLQTQGAATMTALSDLQAQVTASTTVESSAITLIQGIAAALQTALNTSDSAALQALTTQLKTSATSLAAAITANTPASGGTPPASGGSPAPTP